LGRIVRCSKCDREAVTFIRYNGTHLCDGHFLDYVERRVKKEVRRQVDLRRGNIIAVGVSGGKDSMATLLLLKEIFEDRRDVEVHALTVDEGIAGYRPPSVEKVRRMCANEGIPFHLTTFREVAGTTMDDISSHTGAKSPCTFCGVIRRRCLNTMAREMGAAYLATGLNLDDTAQSIMMNFTRGDVERLARMGPHVRVQPGLVPRIQPLRGVPEKESYLYAILRGIDFWDGTCPYADAALRNQYREVVDRMEDRSPGTKYSILSSYDSIAPLLRDHYPPADLGMCECGEPTCNSMCKACELIEEIRKRKGV
jgi:uncharacterized protein (TIGR00269 family)